MSDNQQKQESQSQQPTQPEKIFGKYDSMEEAQQGYWNSVTEMNKAKEQLGMAVEMIQNLRGQQGQPQTPSKPDYELQLERLGVPTDAISKLVETRATEIANNVIQKHFTPLVSGANARQVMASEYKDFAENEKEILSFVKSKPELAVRFEELLNAGKPLDALELGYFHYAKQKPVKPAEDKKKAAGMPQGSGGSQRIPETVNVDKSKRIEEGQRIFADTRDFMPLFNEVLGDMPLTWTEHMERLGRGQ